MIQTFFWSYAAWGALALSMDRHHQQATGREPSGTQAALLRTIGVVLMSLSVWAAIHPGTQGPPLSTGIGIATWAVVISVSALCTTATFTWLPTWSKRFATAAFALAVAWLV